MAINTIHGESNNNETGLSKYQQGDRLVFYVRPFTEEIKQELARLSDNLFRLPSSTIVFEENGTYCVLTDERVDTIDFWKSLWGMLFRRYRMAAEDEWQDRSSQQKFYRLLFSSKYIQPCAPKLVSPNA